MKRSLDQITFQQEEEELQKHQEYHDSQKIKSKQEAMNKLKLAEEGFTDDGKDYGDQIFNVPNSSRFIIMSGNEHYYQVRAATIGKLVERLTSLIPAFYEECELIIAKFNISNLFEPKSLL